MKKIFQILIWVIVLSGISVILGFALIDQKTVRCTALSVSIADKNPRGFITSAEIEKLVYAKFDSIRGELLDSLDIEQIEINLAENPYIKNVNVYTTVHGNLSIEVEREEALIRIINKKNEGYYLSRSGRALPLSKGFIPHVVVASGNINDSYDKIKDQNIIYTSQETGKNSDLSKLYFLAGELEENNFLSNHIKQVYVNQKGDIELIPENGKYIILLGDVNDIEIKFENLLAFYQAGLPKVGIGNISVVNLKYKNQVVCEK